MSVFYPTVSVLMTAYNREKYIAAAIESVLSSTFNDFEIIIVDDKSQDNTVDIANAYAAQDNRIKVFVNEKNLGDYPNRNRAASYAKGKYLKYVDADDYIYPWGLNLLVQMMEQFPEAGYGLCSLNQNNDKPYPFLLSPKEAYEKHYLGSGLFNKAPLSSIIKRSVFEAEGGFKALRMVGDFEMWHRLSQKYSVVAMPHGIVWYRIHGEQEVKDRNQFEATYRKIEIQYITDKDTPISQELKTAIIIKQRNKYRKRVFYQLLRLNFLGVVSNFRYFQMWNIKIIEQNR